MITLEKFTFQTSLLDAFGLEVRLQNQTKANYSRLQQKVAPGAPLSRLIDDEAKPTLGEQNKRSCESTRSYQEQYSAAYSSVVYPKLEYIAEFLILPWRITAT